jgi:ParB family chromosome partitioning protein
LSSLISVSDGAGGELAAPTVPPVSRTIPSSTRVSTGVTSTSATAEVETDVAPTSHIAEIPLDKIVPNPHQPRRQMNEATIAELAASLKSTGLIQPIVLRKVGDQYQLIAGERRWRAAKVAGLLTVPAIIREATSAEQAQMALVENIQRENLNPIDRALAYKTLMTQLGLTQVELAQRMGEDRSGVANHLRLLDLTTSVQAMVVAGSLSLGHAKILAGVDDPQDQERLANLVVNQSLSVRNLERHLAEIKPVATRNPVNISAHLLDLEKSLSQQLGLRVQVRSASKGKGRLVLHYGTLDQFDDLVTRLGAKYET